MNEVTGAIMPLGDLDCYWYRRVSRFAEKSSSGTIRFDGNPLNTVMIVTHPQIWEIAG